jgi:hypothetical protein
MEYTLRADTTQLPLQNMHGFQLTISTGQIRSLHLWFSRAKCIPCEVECEKFRSSCTVLVTSWCRILPRTVVS